MGEDKMKLRSMLMLIFVVPVVYFSGREIHRFNQINNSVGEVDSSASVVKDLLNAYREYSLACWADSVWIDHMTLALTCDISRGSKKIWHPELNNIWVSEAWVHPEPSFVGFMNFVRDKIEGERQ